MTKDPKTRSGASRGENASETDRTDPSDIDTAHEQQQRAENPSSSRKFNFKYTPDEKYRGYWNSKENQNKATQTYAAYFNAEDHVHYMNGSHDLGSNGAHRVDHGIALGYAWAKEVKVFREKHLVDLMKEDMPSMEESTPKYKPITIVGHSQGACVAAGVALGVIKYAADMGYDKIPINLIFLGVHQPKGLFGKAYEHLIDVKVNHFEANYWCINLGKDEHHSLKYLNSIAELFSEKYKKLYHNRGLFEHLQQITDWNTYKSRAVQFTFTNDRGDLVLRDGDIPQIASACSPQVDSTLFSVEYYTELPKAIQGQNKDILDLKKHGGEGGYIVLPKYRANKRFDYDALEDLDNPTEEQKKLGVEWADYKTVAVRWGHAMYTYKTLKKQYEAQTGKPYVYSFLNEEWEEFKAINQTIINWIKTEDPYIEDPTPKERQLLALKKQIPDAFENVLKTYASLQEADLYAHFSPVALIHHPKLLEDFPSDALGNQSIWQRIQNLGKDKFYRVEYDSDSDQVPDITELEKRKIEKKEIEGKLTKKLISTAIGNTEYINRVIQAYVYNDKAAEAKLYKEIKDGH